MGYSSPQRIEVFTMFLAEMNQNGPYDLSTTRPSLNSLNFIELDWLASLMKRYSITYTKGILSAFTTDVLQRLLFSLTKIDAFNELEILVNILVGRDEFRKHEDLFIKHVLHFLDQPKEGSWKFINIFIMKTDSNCIVNIFDMERRYMYRSIYKTYKKQRSLFDEVLKVSISKSAEFAHIFYELLLELSVEELLQVFEPYLNNDEFIVGLYRSKEKRTFQKFLTFLFAAEHKRNNSIARCNRIQFPEADEIIENLDLLKKLPLKLLEVGTISEKLKDNKPIVHWFKNFSLEQIFNIFKFHQKYLGYINLDEYEIDIKNRIGCGESYLESMARSLLLSDNEGIRKFCARVMDELKYDRLKNLISLLTKELTEEKPSNSNDLIRAILFILSEDGQFELALRAFELYFKERQFPIWFLDGIANSLDFILNSDNRSKLTTLLDKYVGL